MQKRFQINEMIGEYRVTGFLGMGGMGVVYSAVHEKLGRPAAIKVLGTSSTDPSFTTRFFNEARLQAGLHHPNIAALYDFREENGRLFIFMEMVDGECLEEVIARRALTVDETLNVFASICEAISYIHQNGVIHRDIKSQNVKISSSGVVKLLDFGIAKDGASHGLTQTGGVIGTPTYLSPEQLEGKPATEQADIWALGVLLYEMLAGQPPFEGDTLGSLVLKITKAEFVPAEKSNPAVPKNVAAIVAKCLKKDLPARYLSVEELLDAVRKASGSRHTRAALAGGNVPAPAPVNAFPATILAEAGGPKSGGKGMPVGLIAGIAGAAAVLLLVLFGGVIFLSGEENPARASTSANQTADAPKGSMQIRVDVDEGKAQVLKAGKLLGATPLDISADPGDELALTLTRDGFEDKNVNIKVTSGKKVFTFSMKSNK